MTMARTKKKGKKRIRFSSSGRIVEKKDKTNVVTRIDSIKKIPVRRVIPDNAATFKLKIRKK